MKKFIDSDILGSIKANLEVGNIILDDYNQLLELLNKLYQQIMLQYQRKGGDKEMKPLLPGAMELPNDKYRFRIDELETEVAALEDRNAALESEMEILRRKLHEMANRSEGQ